MKQVQDAYIVAATRTPIGRSHKGFFRNYRPDDLLATRQVSSQRIDHGRYRRQAQVHGYCGDGRHQPEGDDEAPLVF